MPDAVTLGPDPNASTQATVRAADRRADGAFTDSALTLDLANRGCVGAARMECPPGGRIPREDASRAVRRGSRSRGEIARQRPSSSVPGGPEIA
jgi:hypothetical protein